MVDIDDASCTGKPMCLPQIKKGEKYKRAIARERKRGNSQRKERGQTRRFARTAAALHGGKGQTSPGFGTRAAWQHKSREDLQGWMNKMDS